MKRKITGIMLSLMMAVSVITGCASPAGDVPAEEEKVRIKVLILPKFEVGEMSGDFAGEAQLYYVNASLGKM